MLTLVPMALACAVGRAVSAPAAFLHAGGACEYAAPTAGVATAQRQALANGVRAAMLDVAYLQVNARIVHQGRELLVRSDMTAHNLRVEAFRDGALIAAFAIDGDRVQEYRPVLTPSESGSSYYNVVAEFDKLDMETRRVSVVDTMLLEPDIGCEFGTLMASWVDPLTSRAEWWADRILGGEQREDQVIAGRRCIVFHEFVTAPANDERGELTITNTEWIDAETMLPVRWDTTQSTSEYAIHRERHYTITASTSVPSELSWKLDPRQLQRAEPSNTLREIAAR